jgi:hypothetical protein
MARDPPRRTPFTPADDPPRQTRFAPADDPRQTRFTPVTGVAISHNDETATSGAIATRAPAR